MGGTCHEKTWMLGRSQRWPGGFWLGSVRTGRHRQPVTANEKAEGESAARGHRRHTQDSGQMGGEDSEKKATEPPGPSEAKESGNAWAGGAETRRMGHGE